MVILTRCLLSVPPGTRCGGNVTATRRNTPSSPCGGRCLRSGTQPRVGSAAGLRQQPAAGGHDEADDGDGEEDADDGAAEAATDVKRAKAAAAASSGRAGEFVSWWQMKRHTCRAFKDNTRLVCSNIFAYVRLQLRQEQSISSSSLLSGCTNLFSPSSSHLCSVCVFCTCWENSLFPFYSYLCERMRC